MKRVLSTLPFISVFLFTLYHPLDTDLGWHLKYGEYFLTHGKILTENIFSSSMTNYHWINHSWLSDGVTYLVFNTGSFWGISIAGALMITLTFYFISRASNLSFWQKTLLFPLGLYFMEPFFTVSFRSQLVSLMVTTLACFLFSKYQKGSRRVLFFFPLLFLFWANFHGGFILGLGIFTIWSLVSLGIGFRGRTRFNNYFLILILLISYLVPLLNPFGIEIYLETFRHLGNPLANYISEWTAFDSYSVYWWRLLSWGLYLVVSLYYLGKQKKLKENLPFLVPVFIFFIFSFWERRYTWTMFVLSIPIIKELSNFVTISQKKISTLISVTVFTVISVFALYKNFIGPFNIKSMNWDSYCLRLSCSANSIKVLENTQYKNLLTFYDWGGWLIWNYPKVLPSIDGRMSFWIDDTGYSAFEEYFYYEQNLKDIDRSKYDTIYISTKKPMYFRLIELTNEGKWHLVYRDRVSAIFKRNHLPQVGPVFNQ